MGLLSRLRGSSTHPSAIPPSASSPTASTFRPTTPLPTEHSGSSFADGDITPKAKEKKPFSLWKGKAKADTSVGGRRYEDLSHRGAASSRGGANGQGQGAGSEYGGGKPRRSGAWDRDSIYSERPASPLDPPSRVWGGAGGERQRSVSASGIHPPNTDYSHPHLDPAHNPTRSQFPPHAQHQSQHLPPTTTQRVSSDFSRIPPSPSSIRTAPMGVPSSRSHPSSAYPDPAIRAMGHAPPPPPLTKETPRVDIPIPAGEGGFLGKLTFEDKSTRRDPVRREREPSWLVGSMDDGAGLFGFPSSQHTQSTSSIATSGPEVAPSALLNSPTAPPITQPQQHAIIASVPAPTPPSKVISPVASPSLQLPKPTTAPIASPPTSPSGPVAAPSAWRPEIAQAVATALPPSIPASAVSSPVVDQEEEKKGKFWKARGRRSSKAMSDMDHEAASPAETPASTARQPESSSSSRPPQLRRPSSSFFVRPFNRVSSRTSVFDLETTPVDDGSFQLKGFRHVSGVSGLKDDGGASKDEETIMDGPIAAQDEWKPVPPVRPTLARPSSALSNRTLDEMSSAKVSVAAFKRGIRRPSETLDKSAADDDDEDDDVPLGMLNRHNLPRPASSASISRLASPSVASPPTGMGATARPSTIHTNSLDITREMTPNQGATAKQGSLSPVAARMLGTESPKEGASQKSGHAGNTFVVRSARSTRSLHSFDSREKDGRSVRSVTPDSRSSVPTRSTEPSRAPTRPTSAMSMSKHMAADEEEYIVSPAKQPAYRTSNAPGQDPATSEAMNAADDARSRAASPTPGPLIAPLGLPLPQESPSMAEMEGLVLPPRPDEIEEEAVSPRSVSTMSSPRARVTAVVEPLKRLSGFLSSTSLNKSASDDDGFDTSLALRSIMFAEQDSRAVDVQQSPPSSGSRPSLQERLNAIKPAVPPIKTDLSPTGSNVTEVPPVMSVEELETPTARTHLSALAGKLTPIASQEGSSREEVSSDSSGLRTRPFGPRDQPSAPSPTGIFVSSPTTFDAPAQPQQSSVVQADDIDSGDESDESSDEETLAQLKTRASRSTLNLSRPPPISDDASSTSSSPRTARSKLVSPSPNDLSLRPVSSRVSSTSPSVPKLSISPSDSTFRRPGVLHEQSSRSSMHSSNAASSLPISPSAKSVAFVDPKEHTGYPIQSPSNALVQAQNGGARGRSAYSTHDARTSASPASSQSGLTGDSAPGPMTPGEGSVNSMTRSNRPGMSSSQSSFSLTEDRQRRMSLSSNAGGANDPATLSMMKQQWQAQFMAAAYAASEEQWERASSVGGAGDNASQSGYFGQQPSMPMSTPFGYQMPAMPTQNQQQMLGMGMPYGMQFPGMPIGMQMPGMPGMPGMPNMANMGMPMGMQFPFGFPNGMMAQGMPGMQGMLGMQGMSMPGSPAMGAGGMYSYGPGAQSVFGGEFGPPTGHRGYSSPDVRSVSASNSGNGLNGSNYVSSPLAQPPHGSSGTGNASRPSSRHSRSTSNLRGQATASVYGTATPSSNGIGASRNARPRHHSNARSVSALPTIQQSPQKDSGSTPRQTSHGGGLQEGSPLRPGPRAQSSVGEGMRHSSYDLLSAAPPPPSSWRNGGSDAGRARPRTHFAS